MLSTTKVTIGEKSRELEVTKINGTNEMLDVETGKGSTANLTNYYAIPMSASPRLLLLLLTLRPNLEPFAAAEPETGGLDDVSPWRRCSNPF